MQVNHRICRSRVGLRLQHDWKVKMEGEGKGFQTPRSAISADPERGV